MEIWKGIEGYEDYEVSNLGRVKSLKFKKTKILKRRTDSFGYEKVGLFINGKQKTKRVHQLVAVAFLDHTVCGYKLVINHIDFNKRNNNISNLEIVTARENTNRKHLPSSSKYVGVAKDKRNNRWISRISINGINKCLGTFKTELEASKAYQKELNPKG